MKVFICSGGTGGHMFPACALMRELSELGHDTFMVTDERGNAFCEEIDEKIVLKTIKLDLQNITGGEDKAAALVQFGIWLIALIIAFVSVVISLITLYFRKKPDVVISFGGLFTIIPSIIAKLFRAKLIIYEQNSVLGKANKFLSHIANMKLCTLMKAERDWIYVPSPVRRDFVDLRKFRKEYDKKRLNITVIGGSQGAASFASLIPSALSKLPKICRKKIHIVQQVGHKEFNELKECYEKLGIDAKLITFIHNVAEEMAASDLVICRSGASTIAELRVLNLPAILIPYPKATEDHQYLNALHCEKTMGAFVVRESEDPENKICEIIQRILNDDDILLQKVRDMKSQNKYENFVEAFEDSINQALLK